MTQFRQSRMDRLRTKRPGAMDIDPYGSASAPGGGGFTPMQILRTGGVPGTISGVTGAQPARGETYNPTTPAPTVEAPQPSAQFDINQEFVPGPVSSDTGFSLNIGGGGLNIFKEGGQVGPSGKRIPHTGLKTGQQALQDPQIVRTQMRDALNSNPQVSQQVQAAVQQAMASGELTPAELQTAIRLAEVAANDPATWPRIRAYAIQNGIAEEGDIPLEYDAGLVYALLAVGEAMAVQPAQAPAGQAPQQPGQPQQQDPGAVPITAHEGEYVIPKHVVDMKGKEFFDRMLSTYDPNQQPK